MNWFIAGLTAGLHADAGMLGDAWNLIRFLAGILDGRK